MPKTVIYTYATSQLRTTQRSNQSTAVSTPAAGKGNLATAGTSSGTSLEGVGLGVASSQAPGIDNTVDGSGGIATSPASASSQTTVSASAGGKARNHPLLFLIFCIAALPLEHFYLRYVCFTLC